MATGLSLEDAALIAGNASPEIKQNIANLLFVHTSEGLGFGDHVGQILKLTEAFIIPMAEESKKTQARLVFEIDLTRSWFHSFISCFFHVYHNLGMLNGSEVLHGACVAYFIDVYTLRPRFLLMSY